MKNRRCKVCPVQHSSSTAHAHLVLVRSRPIKQGSCYFYISTLKNESASLMRFIRALSTSAPLLSHSNCASPGSFSSPCRMSEVRRFSGVQRNTVHPKLLQKEGRSGRCRCRVDDLWRISSNLMEVATLTAHVVVEALAPPRL